MLVDPKSQLVPTFPSKDRVFYFLFCKRKVAIEVEEGFPEGVVKADRNVNQLDSRLAGPHRLSPAGIKRDARAGEAFSTNQSEDKHA